MEPMLKKLIDKVTASVKKSESSPSTPRKSAKTKSAPESKPEVWVPGADNNPPPESGSNQPPRPPRRRSSKPRNQRRKPADAGQPGKDTARSDESARPPQAQQSEDGAPKRRRRRRRRGSGKGPQADNAQPQQKAAEEKSSAPAPKAPAREEKPAYDPSQFRPKNIEAFEGQLRYPDMDIPDEVKRALAEMHFEVTTPIQARLLPIALAGRDAAGKAQTGTGKTAAFLIGIFTHFLRKPIEGERPNGTPRALILAPTRELALQIQKDAEDIGRYCGLHSVAVYGGMDFDRQQRQLEQPVDIIVATPGRLMDFAQRKVINLRQIETLVIDEADRMLDMGFIPDVRKIVRMTPHPEQRQTLLFSATLTPNIVRLAEQWTRDAETVEIEPEQIASDTVNQRVIITTQDEKFTLLYNLLQQEKPERVIIFSNRRDQAEMLHNTLQAYGFSTALLSGAVDQKKRVRVLDDFKSGKVEVLVATDVAGRGLHVEGISHVINYHMPMDPDDYVHRIGRTGRAGEIGTSISFACELDSFAIPDVEAFIGHPLVCEHPADDMLKALPEPLHPIARLKPRGRNGSGGGRGPRRGGGGGGGGGRGRPPRRR